MDVTDGDRQGISRVVGRGQDGQAEHQLDHLLNLMLLGPSFSALRAFAAWNRLSIATQSGRQSASSAANRT
jgi:hypothetical protein